ncbi:MAG: DUF3822 family protein [Bacteroidaceae bacterium]|nr:DUF3822 family protein [Bacteroidaceae bacterium]
MPNNPALFIHVTADDLTLARRFDSELQTHRQPFNRRVSFTLNLREALAAAPASLVADVPQAEVYVATPVSVVPLSEFAETDAEAIHRATFRSEERSRLMTDVLPAAQIVLVYEVAENIVRAIEEAFPKTNYHNALSPIVPRTPLSASAQAVVRVYVHENTTDALVYQGSKFIALNSFQTRHADDASFFVLGMTQALGYEASDIQAVVVGDERRRIATERSLSQFVATQTEELSPHFASIPYSLAVAMMFQPTR